ncbi:MAG TPA: asparagine synthase-related protein [Chlamydiales bacterium]|nr:asparagine synthase-related protein [Chlamydiales bacterium]
MLSWVKPEAIAGTLSQERYALELFDHLNASIGTVGGDFFVDTKKGITVAFSGKLFRPELLQNELKIPYIETVAALIAAGFHHLGPQVFQFLDGHFTVTILDQKKREITCARSRLGSQELFWYQDRHTFLFGTHLKALLSTGQISSSCDLDTLAAYLFLGYVPQDKTPIQGVNRLLPGYSMTISFDGKLTIHPFWSFSACFAKAKKVSVSSSEELYSIISDKISQAILRRYKGESSFPAVFDATVGSRIIQESFLKTTEEAPIPALSVEFDTSATFSASTSRAMLHISPDKFLKTLIPLIWTTELPNADPSQVAYWHFVELAQKHNLTPFFDTGCNTLFDPSYHTTFEAIPPSLLQKGFSTKLYQLFCSFAPKLALKWLRRAQKNEGPIAFIEKRGRFTKQEFKELSSSLGPLFQSDLFLHQFYHLPRIQSEAAACFYLAVKSEVSDKWHTSRCKIADSFGVDPEAPFLDVELLEFLASLTDDIWASPDLLPLYPEAVLGQKVSFEKEPRLESWFKHPQIIELIQALEKGLLVESGFISAPFLEKLRKQESPGSFGKFYSIIVLELWMRLFIDMPLLPTNGNISLNDLLLKK